MRVDISKPRDGLTQVVMRYGRRVGGGLSAHSARGSQEVGDVIAAARADELDKRSSAKQAVIDIRVQ